MMKKKTERIPIYEKEPELKKFVSDPNCTFKPNLSKTLKRIPWFLRILTIPFKQAGQISLTAHVVHILVHSSCSSS